MKKLIEWAPAKINLCLEVLGKRPDGFHQVRMLMASLGLADRLELSVAKELSLRCDDPKLDCGSGNLVLRAALALRQAAKVDLGARIVLRKRVPIAAGLAGGSADAAATLRGLNKLWRLGWSQRRLERLGATLGSDIPFCVRGGWALAHGRGERLRTLKAPRQYWVVLLNPGLHVSTPWAYKHCLKRSTKTPNKSLALWNALGRQNYHAAERNCSNDLESATATKYRVISQYRTHLLESGALLSRMSGSGPTVWGLFKNEALARRSMKSIKIKAQFSFACPTSSSFRS